ncbi:MAG: serine hydrolase [Bacteroidales bacterium]|nr:serine hydrolase [Bacteroidales bacterium]
MGKLHSIILLLFILFIVAGCRKKEDLAYSFTLAGGNGINEQALSEAYVRAGEIKNLRSLLVARNNVLVSEVYFAPNARDELHDVMSVTKSVTSTLVGIAIGKGFITSLDQTLGDFIGSSVYNLPEDKAAISLYNMLRMSAGIPWKELGGESEFVDWYYHSADHINYILDKEMTYTPGTHFNYSDGTAHLVSVVLTEATGMAVSLSSSFLRWKW